MKRGYYWELDKNSSVEKGLSIFRYLELSYRPDKSHPIYVVLRVDSIDFYFQGIAPSRQENGKKGYLHSLIFSLPLCHNSQNYNGLSSRLVDAWDHQSLIEGDFDERDDHNINRVAGYSGLHVFVARNRFTLRRLVLDFIFDLEHSKIFQNSPYYNEILHSLNSCFLFSAISAKAKYYYERLQFSKSAGDEHSKLIWARILILSEKYWLSTLRLANSLDEFQLPSSRWFKDAEEEYTDVLFATPDSPDSFDRKLWQKNLIRANLENQEINKTKKINLNILHESAKWFIRRYRLIKALNALLQVHKITMKQILVSAIFVLLVFPLFGGLVLHLFDRSLDAIIIGSFTYLTIGWLVFSVLIVRLVFLSKFGLEGLSLLMPRMLFAIAFAWLAGVVWVKSIDISINLKLGVLVLVLFLLLALVTYLEMKKITPDLYEKKLIGRVLGVIGVGFLFSLVFGLFFTQFVGSKEIAKYEGLSKFIKEAILEGKVRFLNTDSMLMAFASLQDVDESSIVRSFSKRGNQDLSNTINPHQDHNCTLLDAKWEHICFMTDDNELHFIIPENYQSIDSGGVFHHLHFKMNHTARVKREETDLAILDVWNMMPSPKLALSQPMPLMPMESRISNIHDLIEQHDPAVDSEVGLNRKLSFLVQIEGKISINHLETVLQSFLWDEHTTASNIVYFNFLDELKPEKDSFHYIMYNVPLFPGFSLRVFPGILLYWSIFSLFIGVFTQLLFKDKPVTEPA